MNFAEYWGHDVDFDESSLDQNSDFNNCEITTWECKDGTELSISKMSDKHIRNCIAMIKRSIRLHRDGLIDHIWRIEYLEPLQTELLKREDRTVRNALKNIPEDEFKKLLKKWRTEL